jgi:hypothetical protein
MNATDFRSTPLSLQSMGTYSSWPADFDEFMTAGIANPGVANFGVGLNTAPNKAPHMIPRAEIQRRFKAIQAAGILEVDIFRLGPFGYGENLLNGGWMEALATWRSAPLLQQNTDPVGLKIDDDAIGAVRWGQKEFVISASPQRWATLPSSMPFRTKLPSRHCRGEPVREAPVRDDSPLMLGLQLNLQPGMARLLIVDLKSDDDGAHNEYPVTAAVDVPTKLMIFADDSLLASIDPRLERRNNAPFKGPRVIQPTEPWENWAIFAYNSVVYVGPGEYRLYYDCVAAKEGPNGDKVLGTEYVCLATSVDGVRWVKPKLGLFNYSANGSAPSSANNILVEDGGNSVFLDENPAAPASERWKMAVSTGAYASPDGLRWTKLPFKPIAYDDTKPVSNFCHRLAPLAPTRTLTLR